MRGEMSCTLVVVALVVVLKCADAQLGSVAPTMLGATSTPSLTVTPALACEGGHASLACPSSTYINIVYVLFGRDDNNITCPHATALTNVTTCSAPNATYIVNALCQGRPTCDLSSSTSFFNDPCTNVYKFLRVNYTCSPCVNALGSDAQCEMMALQGQCAYTNVNSTYMATNCARACYKCESFITPICTNQAASPVNCTQLVIAGQCLSNPAYMTAYCKQSCGQCQTPTPCVNNYANTTQCNVWSTWSSPQCVANPNYMLAQCSLTCFACQSSSTIKCQNQNPLCDTWAQQAQCTVNPGYMIAACTQSCLGCTTDPACMDMDIVNCPGWANAGQCSANAVWMFQNCWKSCTQCSGASSCINVYADALCEGRALAGQCASGNITDMYTNCRKSCTRCSAWTSSGTPNCINVYSNTTQCNLWATQGLCVTNAQYMYANCYASCTGCVGTSYSIAKLGTSSMPGSPQASNAAYNIILPFAFTTASIITEFIGYFASTTPVYLQLWRPNGTNIYYLVNQIQYTPIIANATLQVIITSTCMVANPGDQIGFTSIESPASVGSSMLTGNSFTNVTLKQVTYTGPFFSTFMTLSYSIAAVYQAGTSCAAALTG